jgi:hypothetical protein
MGRKLRRRKGYDQEDQEEFFSRAKAHKVGANVHDQRCEPAVYGAQIENDLNGWLASAEWCG